MAFVVGCLVGLVPTLALCDEPATLPGFRHTAEFAEQERWTRLASGVRVYVNAPLDVKTSNCRLVIYATPNGNTIEQTLGCATTEGRDWHFDIQHVAAQIRRLREISPDVDIVLAVVQSPKLSWPTFRQTEDKAGDIIRSLVESLAGEVDAKKIVLSVTAAAAPSFSATSIPST